MNPSNCIRDTSQRFCVTYFRPGQGVGGFPTARMSLVRSGHLSWYLGKCSVLPFELGCVLRPPKFRACLPDLGWIQITPHSRRRYPSALAGTC